MKLAQVCFREVRGRAEMKNGVRVACWNGLIETLQLLFGLPPLVSTIWLTLYDCPAADRVQVRIAPLTRLAHWKLREIRDLEGLGFRAWLEELDRRLSKIAPRGRIAYLQCEYEE